MYHLNLANNKLEGNLPEELTSYKSLKWLDLRGNKINDKQPLVVQINFFGISTQPKHIGELNGLTLWGRDSSLYVTEEFQLAVVRSLDAISVEEGLIELSEAKVPSKFVDQAKDLKEFVNSYLLKSDTRINTIMDLERMIAKAQKHALTKTLERLDSMANPEQVIRFEAR